MNAPTWNLETLFEGGITGEAFTTSLARVEAEVNALVERADQLGAPGPEWVDVLLDLEDLTVQAHQLSTFAHCCSCADACDRAAAFANGRVEALFVRIERGIVHVGDKIQIIGLRDTFDTTCTGVEMFNKTLEEGQAGDNVGALMRGVDKEQVERGQVLAKPGSITPHATFEGEIYVLTKEEGGRHTPFFNGYKPQFYFRTTDVTGNVELTGGAEMCMPGDNITMKITLGKPIAMEEQVRFAIREGGRTVGAGVVTKIVE